MKNKNTWLSIALVLLMICFIFLGFYGYNRQERFVQNATTYKAVHSMDYNGQFIAYSMEYDKEIISEKEYEFSRLKAENCIKIVIDHEGSLTTEHIEIINPTLYPDESGENEIVELPLKYIRIEQLTEMK